MSQKFHTNQPEFTFREFGIKAMITWSLKNDTYMISMVFFSFGIYQNIIDEDHNEFVEFWHKD
jgi:hypothetical protein